MTLEKLIGVLSWPTIVIALGLGYFKEPTVMVLYGAMLIILLLSICFDIKNLVKLIKGLIRLRKENKELDSKIKNLKAEIEALK